MQRRRQKKFRGFSLPLSCLFPASPSHRLGLVEGHSGKHPAGVSPPATCRDAGKKLGRGWRVNRPGTGTAALQVRKLGKQKHKSLCSRALGVALFSRLGLGPSLGCTGSSSPLEGSDYSTTMPPVPSASVATHSPPTGGKARFCKESSLMLASPQHQDCGWHCLREFVPV